MDYKVRLKRSVEKELVRLPAKPRRRLVELVHILTEFGPTGPKAWPNYGKLKGIDNHFHCHLTGDHAWVACWNFEKEFLTIEVYYAGSHQKTPY